MAATTRRRVAGSRWLLLALALAAVGLAPGRAALAHAVLLDAVPPDGTQLEQGPGSIRLTFNEPVQLLFLRLVDGAGRQLLPEGAARSSDAVVEVRVPEDLPTGGYVVSYRIVSGDGHPVGGALRFRIGAGPEIGAGGEEDRETRWRIAATVARFLVYATLLAAAGGAFFLAFVIPGAPEHRAGARRYTLAATLAAALALVLNVGIAGGLLTLAPSSGLLDSATWRAGLGVSTGASAGISLLGLALLGATLRSPNVVPRRGLLAAAGLVALAGLGMTGHAASAAPTWMSAPAVVAHAAAAALWVGGLVPLAQIVRHAPREAAVAVLRRFTAVATLAVALLVAVGAVLGLLQVQSLARLIETAYGRILLAKLVGVVILLGLAARNRWRLVPALARNPGTGAATGLRRSIGAEIAVAVLVIATTAALGLTPPPRALALQSAPGSHEHFHEAAAAPGYTVAIPAGGRSALVEFSPATAGTNSVTVSLARDSDGSALDALDVSVELSLPAAGIEPYRRKLDPVGKGSFRAEGVEMEPAGLWHVSIEALITDFDKAVFATDISVRSRATP